MERPIIGPIHPRVTMDHGPYPRADLDKAYPGCGEAERPILPAAQPMPYEYHSKHTNSSVTIEWE